MRMRYWMATGFAAWALVIAVGSGRAESGAATAPVKVYAAGEIAPERYTVLRHLWVDDWRSSVYIPHYGQSGAAIGAILNAAARAGADGVVNLYCVDSQRGASADSFLCYALAVKLK